MIILYLRRMNNIVSPWKGLLSLSPLVVFLLFYVCMSIFCGDFYAIPIIVAFLISCLYSLLILRGRNLEERFGVLARGASMPGLMTMIWIFVLAGAFASTAKATGAIDAVVGFTLWAMPPGMLPCGLFVAACFVSLSLGTSVGTIAALTTVACGLAERTGMSVPMMAAAVVGGAFFGDNLSFISDTTIVATRTQGCRMGDKFRYNVCIAMPAAAVCAGIYVMAGWGMEAPVPVFDTNVWLILPYVFVIVAALAGMNVLLLLAVGTLMAGVIGLAAGSLDFLGWVAAMNEGIMGMSELIIVTMLAAGMVEVIRETGGIDYMMQCLSKVVRGRRGAELSIALSVMLTDFCTANNTIAILSVGHLAREVSARYGVDPRRAASLLDTFSCFAQGIIPYGAQMLIAASLASLNPLEIMPYLYYPFVLGTVALIYILIKK